MNKTAIYVYLILTFIIGWALQIFSRYQVIDSLAWSLTIMLIATTPAFAALLTVYRYHEQDERADFFKRLFHWRIKPKIAISAILGLCAAWIASLFITVALYQTNIVTQAIAIAPLLIVFAYIEEIGWRGFLLPQLLKTLSPVQASLILGSIWAIWHVIDYLRTPIIGYTTLFAVMILFSIALSLYLTWLYLHTNSILLIGIVHGLSNTFASTIPFSYAQTDFSVTITVRLIAALLLFAFSVYLLMNQRHSQNPTQLTE